MAGFELIAAAYTPFAADGSLYLDVVPRQAEWLAAAGVDGVFVGGTTGESLSLSVPERIALAEAWVEPARRHNLRLLIHVGAASLVDTRELAVHAAGVAAAGISAMAPCYFKPSRIGDLADYLAAVAAAAPAIPFYYYDIPAWTGVRFRSSQLLEQYAERIPTLAGIKYTSDDWVDFQRCVAVAGERFRMYWGCDEALIVGLTLGAVGAIGSTFNFLAVEAREVVRAYQAADTQAARVAQYRVVQLVDAIASHGYLPASKALLADLGLDCGTVRPPLAPLTAADRQQLRAACEKAGLSFEPAEVTT